MDYDLADRLRSWADATPCSVTAAMLREAAFAVTLTDAEREALVVAVEYVGSAYQVEHHAATLRGLLKRTE